MRARRKKPRKRSTMNQSAMRVSSSFQDVGGSSLRALSEVLSYSAAAWGKRELARWLAGPYRDATCVHEEAWGDESEDDAAPSPRSELLVSDERVREVVREARLAVASVLQDPGGAFTQRANALLAKGHVLEICDESGNSSVIAVDHERMRLEERILSLAVAYCLMHPNELKLLAARASRGTTPLPPAPTRPGLGSEPPSGVRTRVETLPMGTPVPAKDRRPS